MQTYEKEFGRLCGEVLWEKYQKELSESKETARCSKAHYKKMSLILGTKVRAPITCRQRTMFAILAAALLLLVACAVCYAEPFGEYLVERFGEDYRIIHVGNKDQAVDCTEQTYTPQYLPVGYDLTVENKSELSIFRKYENEKGDRIIFEQASANVNKRMHIDYRFTFDIVMLGDAQVLRCKSEQNGKKYFLWTDEYSFYLSLSKSISDEEAMRILEGIAAEEQP